MSGFLPLTAMLGGFGLGWLVNVISNELAFARGLMAPRCADLRANAGWWRFNLRAWQFHDCPLSWRVRNLAVIVIYGGLAVWLTSRPDAIKLSLILAAPLVAYMGVVTVLDLEHKVVLFSTVWAGLAVGAVVGVSLHGAGATLLGGLVGFGIMYFFYVSGAWFVRWLSRRRGDAVDEVALGFGDVNLAGVMGLMLGWPGVLAGIYLAVLAGGVGSLAYVGIRTLRGGYTAYSAIPYGPFLVLAMAWFLVFRPLLSAN